ncbi:hypothetical protein AYO45_05060 [Gammaproteobacteria bacterium SCGC AG-212-F23]|nr:hypothetical protein AYO45_05060 [Gammaproteobacteria bacterium SCGC AG-212-F23]
MDKQKTNLNIPPPNLLKDPHLSYPSGNIHLAFSDYIHQCQALVQSARPQDSTLIINANTPYELYPETPILTQNKKIKYGVLLVHGLLDSPLSLREIGNNLQAQGCLVRSVLLPGHGTVPGALLHVHYHEWINTVWYGMHSLAKEVEQIYILGYSTGGTLAILHALNHPEDNIAGIIAIVPALKIKSVFAPLSGLASKLGRLWHRAAWAAIMPENDYAKYQSIAMNGVYQVYQLTQLIKQHSKQLPCPTLAFLTEDDKTICTPTAIRFLQQQKQAHKIILYKKNPHTNSATLVERPSYYPEENIHDFSHVALPCSPQNKHYGKTGDYYGSKDNENYQYGSYVIPELQYYDFLYRHQLLRYPRRLLTYNPDFNYLIEQIEHFIIKQ